MKKNDTVYAFEAADPVTESDARSLNQGTATDKQSTLHNDPSQNKNSVSNKKNNTKGTQPDRKSVV